VRPEVAAATYSILVRRAQERDVVTYSALSSMVPGPAGPRTSHDRHTDRDDRAIIGREGCPVSGLAVNTGRNGLPRTGSYESLTHYLPYDDQSDPARAARRERERVYAAYPIGEPSVLDHASRISSGRRLVMATS
jgi:hypothetical protein